MSRGLRNNNPGNIRHSAVRFKGETTSADKSFKTFSSSAWGYRAMFVVLHTYRMRHGLDTIRKMIGRWAPPCENDTDAYIDAVAKWSTVDADSPVTSTNRDVMMPIAAAMSRMENGKTAVMADVEAGWELFMENTP